MLTNLFFSHTPTTGLASSSHIFVLNLLEPQSTFEAARHSDADGL